MREHLQRAYYVHLAYKIKQHYEELGYKFVSEHFDNERYWSDMLLTFSLSWGNKDILLRSKNITEFSADAYEKGVPLRDVLA